LKPVSPQGFGERTIPFKIPHAPLIPVGLARLVRFVSRVSAAARGGTLCCPNLRSGIERLAECQPLTGPMRFRLEPHAAGVPVVVE
jgi:hypothetical protein